LGGVIEQKPLDIGGSIGVANTAGINRAATMEGEEDYFRIGDRVRLSELGRERMPRNRATTAKVVGFGRSDTRIRIVFDGSKYPVSIHVSYLKRDG
jgi:hypothetical protein